MSLKIQQKKPAALVCRRCRMIGLPIMINGGHESHSEVELRSLEFFSVLTIVIRWRFALGQFPLIEHFSSG